MKFEFILETAPQIVKTKLEQLKFLTERPDYHPEPSTYHHIRIVTNRLIAKNYSMELVLSGMLHDICKFDCVKENAQTGYPTSPEHGRLAAELIDSNMPVKGWINSFGADPQKVSDICRYHMRIQQYQFMKPNKKQQMESLDCFQDLLLFTACDDMLSEEYKMHDVLPFQIWCEPSEGGQCEYAQFITKDDATGRTLVPCSLTQREFNHYCNTGLYEKTHDCPDDMWIAELKSYKK